MIYVAHPLAGDIAGNCERAEKWLAALMRDNPDETFVLPWVSYVRAGLHLYADPDVDKEFRHRCMRDDLRIAGRCEGIVLCGLRVSQGMALELAEVIAYGPISQVWRLSPFDNAGRLGSPMTLGDARQLLADVQNGVER